jgi:hypothetical protein
MITVTRCSQTQVEVLAGSERQKYALRLTDTEAKELIGKLADTLTLKIEPHERLELEEWAAYLERCSLGNNRNRSEQTTREFDRSARLLRKVLMNV